MGRKLTARQGLIKDVAQRIYDSNFKLDYSDIRLFLSGSGSHWWLGATPAQQKRAELQVKRELDMAYFVIERGGKALVEVNSG